MPDETALLPAEPETETETAAAEPDAAVPEAAETAVSDAGIEPAETAAPAAAPTDPNAIRDGDVVKFLREQTKLSPEGAKLHRALQDGYFRAAEYTKLFSNIDEARTLKTHFEALGGFDGLTELQTLQSDVAELDRKVAEGNPDVINAMAEESPEGFKKLVPAALDTLYRVDPHAYNELLLPLVARTLVDSPLADSVAIAIERLQGGETDAALRELGRIAATFDGLRTRASQPRAAASQTTAAAPSTTAAPDAALAQVGQEIRGYLDSTVREGLKAALEGRNVSDGARNRVVNAVVAEVDAAFANDRNYAARVNALLRAGQTDRAIAFIKQSVDQVRPRALRQVVSELYGAAPAKPAARPAVTPATKGTAPAAPRAASTATQLTRAPRFQDIDWNQTSQTAYVAHRAILKDGREVRWPH